MRETQVFERVTVPGTVCDEKRRLASLLADATEVLASAISLRLTADGAEVEVEVEVAVRRARGARDQAYLALERHSGDHGC